MNKTNGFTLIELMIVVAIIAILAAIAVPSYQEYVRSSRRADALRVIGELNMAQARWRAEHPTYGTLAELLTVGGPSTAGHPHYAFTVTDPPVATTYTITATPFGPQASDKKSGVPCTPLSITNAGVKTPAACWSN